MAALVRDFFFFDGLFAVGFLAHVQALGLMFLLACKTFKILPEFSPRAPTLVLLDSKEAKVLFLLAVACYSLSVTV